MYIYDTLIIGCGYCAVGYAMANKNTLICEEHQLCDTGFYLPLRSYQYIPYEPKTAEGRALLQTFQSFRLFNDGQQNVNGFEFALCKFIAENGVNVLLKTRIINVEKGVDGVYEITVQNNGGLSKIYAKKIVRMTSDKLEQKKITVLFSAKDFDSAIKELLSVFQGATVERAFYEDRRALHIPVSSLGKNLDENTVKIAIYNRWKALCDNAKILMIAPNFYGETPSLSTCDFSFENPVQAFETGYNYAKGENK